MASLTVTLEATLFPLAEPKAWDLCPGVWFVLLETQVFWSPCTTPLMLFYCLADRVAGAAPPLLSPLVFDRLDIC